MIDAWVGVVPESDGRTEMVITWEPRLRGLTAPQVVAVKARTASGTTLFDGRLGYRIVHDSVIEKGWFYPIEIHASLNCRTVTFERAFEKAQ